MSQVIANTPSPVAGTSLIAIMATRYNLEPNKFLATIVNTVFPAPKNNEPPPSNEQVAAFLVVAKEYDLNPFIKEIYAFPTKGGGIVPIVSLDGWVTLINRQPQLDGLEFKDRFDDDGALLAIETTIYRKDRSHPTVVTEYLNECYRNTDPWNKMKARMLRHKSLIQCARIAFGLAGIYDPDEGERIATGEMNLQEPTMPVDTRPKAEKLAEQIRASQNITPTTAPAPQAVIEVCGSCGNTEGLMQIGNVMLCEACKPKPTPVAPPVIEPRVEAPKPPEAKVEPTVTQPDAQTTTPATPPWARPKAASTPVATPSTPATVAPKSEPLSLESQVAEMTTNKPRVKPRNLTIKKVKMPEFADRATTQDAWTQEQYTAAVTAITPLSGNDDPEGKLRSTVKDFIGLEIQDINADTLVTLTGILFNFKDDDARQVWASKFGLWVG